MLRAQSTEIVYWHDNAKQFKDKSCWQWGFAKESHVTFQCEQASHSSSDSEACHWVLRACGPAKSKNDMI